MAFKMKGHTLPGINQRSEGNTDTPDGRSKSSTFQEKSSPGKFLGLGGGGIGKVLGLGGMRGGSRGVRGRGRRRLW